jgi:hypothetical protein
MKGKVREERQGKIERIEERRRTGAHRRCRNCPGKPADVRGYGEGLRRPRCGSIGEAKGERKRMPRAIYRQGFDGYLVREVTAGSKSRRPFPVTERRRREIGGEERADRWVPPGSERKRERGYRFG